MKYSNHRTYEMQIVQRLGHWLPHVFAAVTALVFIIGCGSGVDETEESNPAKLYTAHNETDNAADVATEETPAGEHDKYIQGDRFCRDVVSAISVERFLRDTPSAELDRENLAPAIGFQQYNESFFQYGFLDGKLFSITMLLPRDREGIDREFGKYEDAFGPANSTSIPPEMKSDGATRYASWRLPDYDLKVSMTVQPSQSVGLVLVGSWRSMSKSNELVRRFNAHGEMGERAGEERSTGTHKIKFCWCPPGTFTMGSPSNDPEADEIEKPQVDVILTRGFWIGQTEVTQELWEQVMGTRPWQTEVRQGNATNGSSYPASNVSWQDASEFCAKLTESERTAGVLPVGWEYRLPTEAEWEYACRAGTTSRYSFGDTEEETFEYGRWGCRFGARKPWIVGSYKPNPWGLYDMHGNVEEWCRDWLGDELSSGRDPIGPLLEKNRAARGGGYCSESRECRSSSRHKLGSSNQGTQLGFRVVYGQTHE